MEWRNEYDKFVPSHGCRIPSGKLVQSRSRNVEKCPPYMFIEACQHQNHHGMIAYHSELVGF